MYHKPVDYEKFVQVYMGVYNAGGKIGDVAEQLGNIPEGRVRDRIFALRKKGVNLPPLAKRHVLSEGEIDNLNSIIRKASDATPTVQKIKKDEE